MSLRHEEARAALRRLRGRGDGRQVSSPEVSSFEDTWRRMPEPEVLDAPAGFAAAVVGRLAEERQPGLWALGSAPLSVRFAAVGALALGVGLGAGVTAALPASAAVSAVGSSGEEWVAGATLAESWFVVAEEGS